MLAHGLVSSQNKTRATVGKQVGCIFKYGTYRQVRVFKIRPVQDYAADYSWMYI